VILAPWAFHSTYSFMVKGESERDVYNFLILPFLLLRMSHNQIWISLSRYRTAKGNNRIVDKGFEFEQVDVLCERREWTSNGSTFHLNVVLGSARSAFAKKTLSISGLQSFYPVSSSSRLSSRPLIDAQDCE
jgi:hypothetical protein